MSLSIRITDPSEAEELSQIQKAAFKPLYEKYHDEGNPFLRGPEDILRRLNKFNRHFTILYNDKVVGGVFYRLYGKRSPTDEIGAGEYYLARIYIHPDYQNKGIARDAIILCEKEFPDARFYYVDFPEDMEKNRRCYQSAGYCDTGDRICMDGAPALAMFKKTVSDVFEPAGVSLPMIYEVDKNELQECLDVIHQSFITGAGLTAKFGLSNGTDETATFQRTVIKNSRSRCLVIPSSKIGVDSFIKVCDVDAFDSIITDWDCVEDQIAAIEERGIEITVVEEPK